MELDKPLTLSTAYFTWVAGSDVWQLKGQDDKVILELPKSFTEKQCMQVLHFARAFEVEAFNIGIAFGKGQYKEVFDPHAEGLKNQINELCAMNEKLSTQLERHIIGGD